MTTSAPDRRRWLVLAVVVIGVFLVTLDYGTVSVALPSIGDGLRISQESLSWVVNAYALTFGGFLLLGGRATDLLGQRIVFLMGLGLFALASLAGGLARSETWLISARVVEGLGAALLTPATLAILTTTFAQGAERNKAVAVLGAVSGAGAAVGVLLGGILTTYLGWPWVLYLNAVVGLGVFLCALWLIGESRAPRAEHRFDFAGAVLGTAGLSMLVFALVDAPDAGWGSFRTIGLLALALTLLIVFVTIEARGKAPLLPIKIFRIRTVTAGNLLGLVLGATLISFFVFWSLYMQQVLGYSALVTGLAELPQVAANIIAAGLAAPLIARLGIKPVLLAGLVLIAGGLVWFAQIRTDGTFVGDILGPSLVVGVGLGFGFVSAMVLAVAGVSDADAGLASGLINASLQIGGAIALAIMVTVANSRTAAVMVSSPAPDLENALTLGLRDAFLANAAITILGIILGAVLVRQRDFLTQVEVGSRGSAA